MPLGIGIGLSVSESGGGGAFSPASIPGLLGWYAARLETGLNDGDAVATFTDQSGNGRNATQPTSTKRPLYKTNIINGKPALLFDNVDDCLQTAAIDLTAINGVTLFAVVSGITAGALAMIAETSPTAATNSGAFNLFRQADNTVAASARGGSSSNFITTATVTTGATVISAVYDLSLATNEVTVWLNGTSAGTRPSNNNQAVNFGNYALNMGSRNNGASLPLNGYIAELLIYNSALSAANRQLIEAYLS